MEPLSATVVLIAITTLISFWAFNRPDVTARFTMSPYQISKGNQYYRFLTSGFIHANHIHLLVNMLSFYFFGTAVEMIFGVIFGEAGTFHFVLLYLLLSSSPIGRFILSTVIILITILSVHLVEWPPSSLPSSSFNRFRIFASTSCSAFQDLS